MNERDTRQCRLMDEMVQQYEAGKIPLSSLIGGLDALLAILESADQEWTKAFRRQWGVLEIEYAVALDRQQDTLTSDSIRRISNAIREMRSLLAAHLWGRGAP